MTAREPAPSAEDVRCVVWFSAGAASAVTAKLAIAEYCSEEIDELVIAYSNKAWEARGRLLFAHPQQAPSDGSDG